MQLQFVAGDVAFQGCSLLVGCLHVLDEQVGLFDVLAVHPLLVPQLEQVQVVACQQEAQVLTVVEVGLFGCLLLQLASPDAALDASSGIEGLLGFDYEGISPMGHVGMDSVRKITVGHAAVADVCRFGFDTE